MNSVWWLGVKKQHLEQRMERWKDEINIYLMPAFVLYTYGNCIYNSIRIGKSICIDINYNHHKFIGLCIGILVKNMIESFQLLMRICNWYWKCMDVNKMML